MSSKSYKEAYKYISPNSILVSTPQKNLARLNCPFPVMVKDNFGIYSKGEILQIDKVLPSATNKIDFLIKDAPYPYYHFLIL